MLSFKSFKREVVRPEKHDYAIVRRYVRDPVDPNRDKEHFFTAKLNHQNQTFSFIPYASTTLKGNKVGSTEHIEKAINKNVRMVGAKHPLLLTTANDMFRSDSNPYKTYKQTTK